MTLGITLGAVCFSRKQRDSKSGVRFTRTPVPCYRRAFRYDCSHRQHPRDCALERDRRRAPADPCSTDLQRVVRPRQWQGTQRRGARDRGAERVRPLVDQRTLHGSRDIRCAHGTWRAARDLPHGRYRCSPVDDRHHRPHAGTGSARSARNAAGADCPSTCCGRAANPQPQPQRNVRHLCHRAVEPLRACRSPGRRRVTEPGLQPALHSRCDGPRKDASAAVDRALRHDGNGPDCVLRHVRGVHERVHRCAAREEDRALQEPVSHVRRAVGRRHPVLVGPRGNSGRVLPHLQHAARGRRADRARLRPPSARDHPPRGSPALALRVGPHDRRAAAGSGDAHRDSAEEGGARSDPDRRPRGARCNCHACADKHPRARGRSHAQHCVRNAQR